MVFGEAVGVGRCSRRLIDRRLRVPLELGHPGRVGAPLIGDLGRSPQLDREGLTYGVGLGTPLCTERSVERSKFTVIVCGTRLSAFLLEGGGDRQALRAVSLADRCLHLKRVRDGRWRRLSGRRAGESQEYQSRD